MAIVATIVQKYGSDCGKGYDVLLNNDQNNKTSFKPDKMQFLHSYDA